MLGSVIPCAKSAAFSSGVTFTVPNNKSLKNPVPALYLLFHNLRVAASLASLAFLTFLALKAATIFLPAATPIFPLNCI